MLDNLSNDLIEKFKALIEQRKSQNIKQRIETCVELLSIANILVDIHEQDLFFQVEASTYLGESYLAYDCIPQAIEHLSNALQINDRLFQNQESKEIHMLILVLISDAYIQNNQLPVASNLLDQCVRLEKTLNSKESLYAQRLIAKILVSEHKLLEANELYETIQKNHEQQSDYQKARFLFDYGFFQQQQEKYEESFELYQKGVEIYYQQRLFDHTEIRKYLKQQMKLSHLAKKSTEIKANIIRNIYQILEQLDDPYNEKKLKYQNTLAMLYYEDAECAKEALQELSILQDLQILEFGDQDERSLITKYKIAEIHLKSNEKNKALELLYSINSPQYIELSLLVQKKIQELQEDTF